MKSIGIFIGRMNPPHLGHLNTIKISLEENDKTMVFLGSTNMKNENNPYSYEERKNMLKSDIGTNLDIIGLADTKDDKDWVINLGKKLISYNNLNITIYHGDTKNDYAIQAIKKYEKYLGEYRVLYKEINRNKLPLSSTLVRKAIKEKNNDYLKATLSKYIYNFIIN